MISSLRRTASLCRTSCILESCTAVNYISRHALSTSSEDSHSDFMPKKKAVPGDDDAVQKLIAKQVQDNPVMLYMKGTPNSPMCGFSAQVVRILHATGVDFSSVNVLEHDSIREGIKKFSDWPTIPQVYIKGEFIGGCDILTGMFQSGDLQDTLEKSKLLK
mmetsp:Transcript_7657/g.11662  ORF Transcript_7657/g.11662 Transcript_7657/m.11662 type:complete len:161 (-) Transcript_7657:281-763(-)